MGESYLLWVLELDNVTQLHAHVRKLSWQRLPARGACAATSGHNPLKASLVQRVPARQRHRIQQHLPAHGAATAVVDLRLAGALVPGAARGRRVAIGVLCTRGAARAASSHHGTRGSPLALPGKLQRAAAQLTGRRGWRCLDSVDNIKTLARLVASSSRPVTPTRRSRKEWYVWRGKLRVLAPQY
jgi:hypothetical protein